jgi:DNA-binding transcriptional ArsR family regulator
MSETLTSNPIGLHPEQANRWLKTLEIFSLYQHEPDMDALRIVYSAVAAHFLPGPLVWVFDVAPPSSGKTKKLVPLEKAAGAHIISNVTPRTFLSGYANTDHSLLNKIKNGILVWKDFSQLLALSKNDKASVLADLREIYDGLIQKSYGTGETKRWEGRITLVAAATPDLDNHYSIFQTLGERFLQVRSHRPGGVRAGEAAIKSGNLEGNAEIQAAVSSLFIDICKRDHEQPQLTDSDTHLIANLAEFCVRGRTHVPREGYTKEVIYMPEPEASPRLAQQFAQLARGSALLEGRSAVNAVDLALVRRVMMDSIRKDRRDILDALVECGTTLSSVTLAKQTGLSQTTTYRRLEELRGMELVEFEDGAGRGTSVDARFSTLARNLLAGASKT